MTEDSRTKDSMTRGRKPQGRGDITGIIPVVRDKRITLSAVCMTGRRLDGSPRE